MRPEGTEIRLNVQGAETHESWISVNANKVSGQTRLFDSEITHQHWVRVRVTRCSRHRDLNRDWLSPDLSTLVEFDMSEAQWGAFVSSFGNGSAVPATLVLLANEGVPSAPFESRLDESHREVKEAGDRALTEIQAAYNELAEAFAAGAGKKDLREKIGTLGNRLGKAPLNMEFAAKSLTEHVEKVVTKAKFDIEAVALASRASGDGFAGLLAAPDSGRDAVIEAGAAPTLNPSKSPLNDPENPTPGEASR